MSNFNFSNVCIFGGNTVHTRSCYLAVCGSLHTSMTEVTRSCYHFSSLFCYCFFIYFLLLFCFLFLFSIRNRKKYKVYWFCRGKGTWAGTVPCITCTSGNEVTQLCYCSIYGTREHGTEIFAVEVFPGCNNSFYTNMCTQGSKNQLFPLPEKKDSEQWPEGLNWSQGSWIVLRVPAYKNIFSWAAQNHLESPPIVPILHL